MVELLISLIVLLLIGGVLYWAVTKIAAAFELPAPVVVTLQVIIVLILVLALFSQLLGTGGWRIDLPD